LPRIPATKVGHSDGTDIYSPLVVVRIETGNGFVEGPALVDSGADNSVVPAELLVPLGIDFAKLPQGTTGTSTGAGGGVETKRCDGRIIYGHTVTSEPTFAVAEPGKLNVVLLGRGDFFRLFVARFHWDKDPPVFDLDPARPR
jgi:hypothetical protein